MKKEGDALKKWLLLHGLLAVSGFCFGLIAYVCLDAAQVQTLWEYLAAQLDNLSAAASPELLRRVFCANLEDLARVYLAGLCLIGLPVLALFLFLKGFTLGFTACFLLRGSVFLLLSRLPFFPLLILAAATGSRFSLLLLQNRLDSPLRQLLQYTVAFAALLALAFLCSWLDAASCQHYLQTLS